MAPCPQPVDCTVDGCLRPARRSGLCWGHLKRSQRGQALVELTERGTEPRRRLLEAILDLADVVDEGRDEERRAWDRVRKAVRCYVATVTYPVRRSISPPGQQVLTLRGLCHLSAHSARHALREAVAAVWDADAMDGAEWDAAWYRLRVAGRRYVLAEKPTNRYRHRYSRA